MNINNHTASVRPCDTIQELIPDYAFGLTDPEETHLVESNLVNCPEAAAQLADYQRLQGNMRLTVPQVEPPPHLGEKLMAAIATTTTTPSATPVAVARSRARKLPLAWFAAAAAIIALIATNLFWFQRVTSLTRQQDELRALLGNQSNAAFVLTETDALRWARLPSSKEEANSTAFMMWNAESEVGLLYAVAFPTLTPGKTYQLWLTKGEKRISAGTFRVDEDGKGALLFKVKEPIDDYTWARITAEPESGSDAPSDTIVVIGELST